MGYRKSIFLPKDSVSSEILILKIFFLRKLKEFLPKFLSEIAMKHPFGRRLDLGEGRCQFSPGVQDEILEMRPGSIGSINPGPFSICIVMSTPQS